MSLLLQIGAVLGGLSFVGGIITAVALWRKTKADAASVLTDSALSIVTDLRGEIAVTRQEMRALRSHISRLEVLLRQHGVPIPDFDWPPPRNGVA